MKIGFGYDLHPLVERRPLIIGGVAIPFTKGLKGHSDADVLCHAVADAILGAAALGDIGHYFPDTDPNFENASSLSMLGQIAEIVRQNGFRICNIDSTIVAEAPKLSPFRETIVSNLAGILNIDSNRISVKAKTNERFGSVGRGEAIVAYAVASLETSE